MTRKPRICRHCAKSKVNRPRGLCWRCYYTPGVRDQYEPLGVHGRAGMKSYGREPSAEEVEAIVAEQMRNLPDWWDAETRRLRTGAE